MREVLPMCPVRNVTYVSGRSDLESNTTELNQDSVLADFLIHLLAGWRSACMGKPYSNDLRDRVVTAMASGQSCRAVGEAFNLAPSTAGNWYRRYRVTSSYAARPMGGDRRSKLTDEAGWIAERLDETCGLTLVEVRGELAKRDIKVSYPSVWRIVRRLGLRHKKNHDLRN